MRNLAAVRLFLAGDDAKQGGLACAIGSDDADDAAFGKVEADVVVQHPIAIGLAQALCFDHQVAQPGAGWDVDLVGFVAFLEFLGLQLFETLQARLALGVPALGVGAHPFQLLFHGLDVGGLLLLLPFQTLFLLLQPGGVIALPGDTVTAVQFQDPACHVVQEITVMGDRHHGAGIFVEEAFQPGDGLGIQVVGGFVQQQHVGFFQQQAAQGDPAAFTPRQRTDVLHPRAADAAHRRRSPAGARYCGRRWSE